MKSFCLATIAVFGLYGCDSRTDNNENSKIISEKIHEVKLGNSFPVTNEMLDKKLSVKAYETNLSDQNRYYYKVEIQNLSKVPDIIKIDQFKLIDSQGHEHSPGLIDNGMNKTIGPNETVAGLIGFDDLNGAEPKFLKLKY